MTQFIADIVDLDSLASWRKFVADDPSFLLSGRDCSIDIHLASDSAELYLRIINGEPVEVKAGPLAMRRSDMSFTASDSSWLAFWSQIPPPGFHDIFAMSSYGHMTIRGDTDKMLRHLGFIKKLLAAPRSA